MNFLEELDPKLSHRGNFNAEARRSLHGKAAEGEGEMPRDKASDRL